MLPLTDGARGGLIYRIKVPVWDPVNFREAHGKIRLLRVVVGWFAKGRRLVRIGSELTEFCGRSGVLRSCRKQATLLVFDVLRSSAVAL